MGDQLILQGQAVVPARLTELGFRWLEPTLDGALPLGAGHART